MSARVRTALWAGAGFLGVLFLGGATGFGLLTAAVAVVGMREYLRLAAPDANPLERTATAAWAGVVVLGFLCPDRAVPGLLLVGGGAVFGAAWILGPGPRSDWFARWGGTVGGWVGVAYGLGHLVWVRQAGVSAVVFVLAVVWAGDIAAYYVGTALGEHPLAPSVSPKKSVEGAAASVVAACLVGWLVSAVLPTPHGAWTGLWVAGVLNLAAQLGDLLESVWKRSAGVKDSGSILPGHGGVLDRVDALLLAAPAYAAVLALVGAGP